MSKRKILIFLINARIIIEVELYTIQHIYDL